MVWTNCRTVLDCLRRRTRMLLCSFWFLLLFSAGGLVLIIHLQDLSDMFPEESPGGKLATTQQQSRQTLWTRVSDGTKPGADLLSSPIPPMQFPEFEGSQDTAVTGHQDQDTSSVHVTRNRQLLKTTLVVQRSNKPSTSSSSSSSSSSTSFSSSSSSSASSSSSSSTFTTFSSTTPILRRSNRIQEARQKLMKEICAKYKSNISRTVTPSDVSRLFVEDHYKLLYCEVPKAGCSNWKRVLIVLSGQETDIHSLKHDAVHGSKYLHTLYGYSRPDILQHLQTYTKLIFVREPMERLVSAFRDKLENPNRHYHFHFGRPIIAKYRANASEEALSTGDGVTFPEFVKYLLDIHPPAGMDIHWKPANQLCNPCLLDYDFIGKFENMVEESNYLLKKVAGPSNLTMPTEKDRDPDSQRTTTDLTNKYLSQVSALERQRLYDFYYMDYLMFNYSKPFSDLY